MNREPDDIREIAEFLDGDRDGESFRRFDDWLSSDETRVAAFVDQLQVAEDLRRLSLHDDVSRYVDSETTPAAAEGRGHWTHWATPLLAVAASFLFAAAMIGVLAKGRSADDARVAARDAAADDGPKIVATLGDAKDCLWEGESYPSGRHFAAGEPVSLLSGAAQFTFETGAILILQGPCRLELSDNAVSLAHGRVAAVVPPTASGFAVMTPSSEVIDIGTEFGVSVDDLDGTQVHVFSGEVVTRARNEWGEIVGEPLHVTTQNAIHFRPGTDDAERFQADEEAFVRWLADLDDTQTERLPPVSGSLALWLTGDNWILDPEGHVNVWRDAISADNRMPDNAIQATPEARPLLVRDAIGGRPAVRFDGRDDCLITTPITTGDNQTIAFVATVLDQAHEDGQILNYNGPPQLQTWERRDPNILQIFVRTDSQRRPRLNPMVFLGFNDHVSIRVGEAGTGEGDAYDFDGPRMKEPFVAVYLYDHGANHAEFWINNRSVGKSSAPAAIEITSRRVIGRHGGYARHFCGDIAEFMIFDEALDAGRIETLGARLAEKYGIEPPPASGAAL